jgi:transposase InsO family protein
MRGDHPASARARRNNCKSVERKTRSTPIPDQPIFALEDVASVPTRPLPAKPGILVQIDTIHDGPHDNRLYSYTMLDVCSRWAYTLPTERVTPYRSLQFVNGARRALPCTIRTLQSDHGSAFSKWFTKQVARRGIAHRHSRIRTPNDNAHLERFYRMIQEQCINRVPRRLAAWHREIPDYLEWYNELRPHIGLKMKSPIDIINAVPRY